MTSGRVLREARERKGYDLDTVARRLRIRPDILRAIEAGDFSAMPPRGYTRNMIHAYARLLSLNPTEIVNMYLDEAYANQVERARGSAPKSGFNMERESHRQHSRTRMNQMDSEKSRYDKSGLSNAGERRATGSYLTRDLYDDRTRYSHDGYGITRERQQREGRSDRDFLSHHSGYESDGYSFPDDNRPQRGGRSIRVGETPMQYSASRLPSFLQSRTVLIILAAIAVLIIVVVIVSLMNRGGTVEEDVSQLPVSGITDTTKTEEEAEASQTATAVAPESARVVMTVPEGKTCYIETYVDGEPSEQLELDSSAEKTVEVKTEWTVTTYQPENLTVTVDGEKVTLESSEKYNGMYAYTVNFTEILNQWKSTHTSKSEQRSAAVAAASNATEQEAADKAKEEAQGSSSTAQ